MLIAEKICFISVKYDVKSIHGAVCFGPDRVSTYTFGSHINGSGTAAADTTGTIHAIWGFTDNTPAPGSCPSNRIADETNGISMTAHPNP